MPGSKLALITGASRGIGLEIARQLGGLGHRVIVAARDSSKAETAAVALKAMGIDAAPVVLDVTSTASVVAAIKLIEQQHGPIGILVNNAAILIDGPGGFDARLFDMTEDTVHQTFETNVLGPIRLIQAVLPGMIARGYGRIVNMSSLAGQLTDMGGGFPAYRMSKAALNALTRIATAEAGKGDIKINSCSPGWVKTDMGGAGATRTVEKGAETPVWLATLGPDGPTGGFFHDKAQVAW